MSESRHSRRGMTLMELLMVIAVIGILIALLIPATIKMRGRANDEKERALRVSFINAVLSYHAEYGDWPVPTEPDALSSAVIDKLRSNDRGKLFWEGDDQLKTTAGQEYKLHINPSGQYPIGAGKEFNSDYTVSVHL